MRVERTYFQRFKLKTSDNLLSHFAFQFNLRHYTLVNSLETAALGVLMLTFWVRHDPSSSFDRSIHVQLRRILLSGLTQRPVHLPGIWLGPRSNLY
jgi:hypothetical protein